MPDHVPLAEPAAGMTVSSAGQTAWSCPPPVTAGPARPDGQQHAWETGGRGWNAFYALVLFAVLLTTATDTPGSKAAAFSALAALVPWYLIVGRPLWTTGQGSRTRIVIYVAGLFVLFGVAQSQNPEAWFLAFAIAPQFFSFLNNRLATLLGIGLNFLAAALLVYRYPSVGTAVTALGVAVAGGGFSLFYGGWVSRIINQSAERAAIIDQLAATQAELAAAQHEAGRMAERQRLAADIHDTLAQGFTSILMLVQAAQADLGGSHPQAAGHLDLAVRTARENLAEARVLVADLTPGHLAGSTLAAALGRLSRSPGVDATFDLSGAPRALPVAAEVVLLRVCQEALANVRKHARARSASVRLGYRPDAVILEVSDDGAGFDPGRVGGGFGLSGMRTRVTEAGGTLTVSSSPGGGTSVRATVPG
ncbi:MAG: sensor histidine kinase [Streptosporangiaceae bacterium]